ncbi:MAG: hypothetical protein WCB04_05865 [Mycobacteriales bacterium]
MDVGRQQVQNPFKPDLWRANHVSNILLGGILAGGIGKIATSFKGSSLVTGSSGLKATAVRLGGNSLAGATGGAFGSGVTQYWLLDKPLDDKDAANAAKTTIMVSGVAAPANRLTPYNTLASPIVPSSGALTTGDWVRQLTGVPVAIAPAPAPSR